MVKVRKTKQRTHSRHDPPFAKLGRFLDRTLSHALLALGGKTAKSSVLPMEKWHLKEQQ